MELPARLLTDHIGKNPMEEIGWVGWKTAVDCLLETLSPEHEVVDCTCVRNNPQGGAAPLRHIVNYVNFNHVNSIHYLHTITGWFVVCWPPCRWSGCPGRSSTGGRSSGCWSCGPCWQGIAKLKKWDHPFHLDFQCCIHVYINIVSVTAF